MIDSGAVRERMLARATVFDGISVRPFWNEDGRLSELENRIANMRLRRCRLTREIDVNQMGEIQGGNDIGGWPLVSC